MNPPIAGAARLGVHPMRGRPAAPSLQALRSTASNRRQDMPKVSRETASEAVTLEGLDVRLEHLEGGYSVCFESHTADADLAELVPRPPRRPLPAAALGIRARQRDDHVPLRRTARRPTRPATPTTCRRATRPSTTRGRRSSSSARPSRSTRRSASSWGTSSGGERRMTAPSTARRSSSAPVRPGSRSAITSRSGIGRS